MEKIWLFLIALAVVFAALFALRRFFPSCFAAGLPFGGGRSRESLKRRLGGPVLLFAASVALTALVQVSSGPEQSVVLSTLAALLKVTFVASIAWFVIGLLGLAEDALLRRFDISAQDNLRARKIVTQMTVFRKLFSIVTGVMALSFILLSFPQFRQVGAGILASVGVIGVIVGLAAQKTVGTLLAGIQLAIAQPIRIDDVLVVEGEWGRVEEITFTYVVVRIWDSRRLVLPTTYFLEHPFQNWTRISSDLLGAVYVYVDYTAPVEAIRTQLKKLLEKSPNWDGRVCALRVTGCSERAMELRALMSAADSSSAWELRCEIRENLIAYLQTSHPDSFPRVRLEREKP